MNTRDRKPTRLKDFDYSSHGAYFVTICAKDRKPIFSQIFVGQGLAPAEIGLTLYGKIAEEQLHKLTERFPSITIDKYVIMPNHIHIIVFLKNDTAGASPCPTLSEVICAYKSLTTLMCKRMCASDVIFQTSFYDHIIRNYEDYYRIWKYIDNNPGKWTEDEYYHK